MLLVITIDKVGITPTPENGAVTPAVKPDPTPVIPQKGQQNWRLKVMDWMRLGGHESDDLPLPPALRKKSDSDEPLPDAQVPVGPQLRHLSDLDENERHGLELFIRDRDHLGPDDPIEINPNDIQQFLTTGTIVEIDGSVPEPLPITQAIKLAIKEHDEITPRKDIPATNDLVRQMIRLANLFDPSGGFDIPIEGQTYPVPDLFDEGRMLSREAVLLLSGNDATPGEIQAMTARIIDYFDLPTGKQLQKELIQIRGRLDRRQKPQNRERDLARLNVLSRAEVIEQRELQIAKRREADESQARYI